MKKRLWWSMLFSSAALLVTSVTAFADRPSVGLTIGSGVGRTPDTIQQIPARVPSNVNGTAFKAWEGVSSTNYLSHEYLLNTPSFADVAVGPSDILTIVNRQIVRYPNPNAMGNPLPASSTQYNDTLRQQQVGVAVGSSLDPRQALLDVWLGPTILNTLCPTTPRTSISCVIDNSTVRYDQLQGRFLVLMTVVNTGLTSINTGNTIEYRLTDARKSSWVLAVSKYAAFKLGTNPSDLFVSPTPGGTPIGGVASANWTFYYGSSLDGIGGDGFGNASIKAPLNQTTQSTTVGAGNINAIPGYAASTLFNCGAMAGYTVPADGTVCYFPTSARLGVDNDNVIIVSAVVNANWTGGTQFAGTRVRVVKKVALYSGKGTLGAGNQSQGTNGVAADEANRAGGDYYDLFANSPAALAVAPAGYTAPPLAFPLPGNALYYPATGSGVAPGPYTVAPGFNVAGTPAPGTLAWFGEPQWLRGRPSASFSNNLVGFPSTSQSYIQFARSNNGNQANNATALLFVQPIKYVIAPALAPANVPANNQNAGVPYYPTLVGTGTADPASLANMQFVNVEPYSDVLTVPPVANAQVNVEQGGSLDTTLTFSGGAAPAAPTLYVGDARPQKVVFREGHLYDTRVIRNFYSGASVGTPVGGTQQMSSTVAYDVVQKINGVGNAGDALNRVDYAQWYNGAFYAPMYDVPANVVLSGALSPINQLPWLEKLFVATTYQQLSQTDPRIQGTAPGWNMPATSITPPAPATMGPGCAAVTPNVQSQTATTNAPYGWSGLYDIRCGDDTYDTIQPVRNPVTGAMNSVVSLTTRNNASIDPNNGSQWDFGMYAARRLSSVNGFGQWSTYIANYDMSFPQIDPYGNGTFNYTDVPGTNPTDQTYIAVQVLKNAGVIPPPTGAGGTVTPVAGGGGNVNSIVVRVEMVKYVITSMMDETAITAYLNGTGGCSNSFSDIADPGCTGNAVTNKTGVLGAGSSSGFGGGWRYVETAYRKGITKGCSADTDVTRKFCPNQQLTRGQMAVFLIRAKMNNVFPTSLNGCPQLQNPVCIGGQAGDNFGLFVKDNPATGGASYFSDVDPSNEFAPYTNKLFELRISNGEQLPTFKADGTLAAQGVFGYNDNLTRGQLMVFLARAFFY